MKKVRLYIINLYIVFTMNAFLCGLSVAQQYEHSLIPLNVIGEKCLKERQALLHEFYVFLNCTARARTLEDCSRKTLEVVKSYRNSECEIPVRNLYATMSLAILHLSANKAQLTNFQMNPNYKPLISLALDVAELDLFREMNYEQNDNSKIKGTYSCTNSEIHLDFSLDPINLG